MGELTQTFNQVQAILNHATIPSATMNNGALIVGGSSGTPTTLPIGTAGQVLTVNSGGTNIGWATAPAVSGSAGVEYIDFTATYQSSYYLVTTSASFNDALTSVQNGGYLYARFEDTTNNMSWIVPMTEVTSTSITFGGDMMYLCRLVWDSSAPSNPYLTMYEKSSNNGY